MPISQQQLSEMDQIAKGKKSALPAMASNSIDQQSQLPQNQNILQKIGDIGASFFPETAKTLQGTPAALTAQAKTLPNAKGNLPQAISNATQQTGLLAKNTIGNLPLLGEIATNAAAGEIAPIAAKAIGKGSKLLSLLARNPTLKRAGKAIENQALKAGTVPAELITKHLDINKLLKGVTTASEAEKKAFARKALDEITSLQPGLAGESTSKTLQEAPNSYAKILEYRANAGNRAYPGKGNAKAPVNIYYKNLQRAYSNILKEGAKTGELDKIYSLLSKAKGIGKAALPYGLGGAIAYGATRNLSSKLFNY